jgi:hypothetical protein
MENLLMENLLNADITLEPEEAGEGKLTITIRKGDIIDLFCLHGEDGIVNLGGYVGDILADQIGKIMEAIPDEQIHERRIELFKKIREESNARNKD